MGKNKIKSSSSSSPPWPWAACGGSSLNTLSFRADENDDAFRTFNSAFLDTQLTPDYNSFFTVCSSSSRSFSTIMSEDSGDPVESVIRGLRSDRLFFEPETTNSFVPSEDQRNICGFKFAAESEHEDMLKKGEGESEEDEEEEGGRVVYKESEMLAMESNNPFEDFRRSMEEMVEAHGLKDWQGLEELLRCYLKINGKKNHGFIVGAFIDLLVTLSLSSSSSTTTTPLSTSITPSTTTTTTTTITSSTSSSLSSTNNSPSSPLSLPSSSLSSSLTTPCLSSILDDDDDHGHVSY